MLSIIKKIFLILFALLSIGNYLNAQKILIQGEETNRKLVWNDFKGNPDASSSYAALTNYDLSYSYSSKSTNGKVTVSKLLVQLELKSNKSWSKHKEDADNLLAHEQGHFDLGILCLYELVEKMNAIETNKGNIKTLLLNTFKQVKEKYSQLHIKYDEETEHSASKENQKEWNAYFKEHLAKCGHKRAVFEEKMAE